MPSRDSREHPATATGRVTDGNDVSRRVETAELLSIGAELVHGETRDTNAYEIARSLTGAGVEVGRIVALPDRRETVEAAFRDALARADLVVSTGGLGPTPDDLTRESVAAVCGEVPRVDPELERWLRDLWARRGLAFAEINLKQAWLIPSAAPLPNPNGTAPGWWVARSDGRRVVCLPGPPREMRPMWHTEALPRLRERGLGSGREVRTLRLTGIGESLVADRLGERLLRATNPEVATYARAEAVDVRLSAVDEPAADGRPARAAATLLDEAEATVVAAVGAHLWARGEATWAEALGAELERLGWRLSAREIGTRGALGTLLTGCEGLDRVESLRPRRRGEGAMDVLAEAREIRAVGGSEVGLALIARDRGPDTVVSVGIATPVSASRSRSVAFLGGDMGRHRAAVAACARLVEALRGAQATG